MPTMAQRSVRAKCKIREAGIPFATPPRVLMAERAEVQQAAQQTIAPLPPHP